MRFTPTKWVDGAATGTGDGSQSQPWTMQQAVANASPGDIIQLNPGIIAGLATATPWQASFSLTRPGTATHPIIWFARNYAALNNTGRTTFTHPGVAPTGNPVLGLHAAYNFVYGIHIHEPDAVPGRDTGAVVITAPHVKLCYCHLDRDQAEWPDYTTPPPPNTETPTNMAGVRIEPSTADVFDVQLEDNLFTNYTAATDVGYGCACVMLFPTPEYPCHSINFQNNTFDFVNDAIYIKGTGPTRKVLGNLQFRNNLSRVNDSGFGINIYHYNLSDTLADHGPNVFSQNLAYGGRMFVRPRKQRDDTTEGLQIINNTVIALTGTGEDGFLRDVYQGNQSVASWKIHNNILQTGPRFYNFPVSGGDGSILSRDHNTAHGLVDSYSYIGGATPPIGRKPCCSCSREPDRI